MAELDPKTCRYCGEVAVGEYCNYSPDHKHEAIGDETICIHCHTTSYGTYCPYSETHVHEHGHSRHKPLKCKWCGSSDIGHHGCPHNPNSDIHEA